MTLPLKDQSDLEWTLGVGLTKFQRSTFGGMLERAEMFSFNEHGFKIPKRHWSQQYIAIKKNKEEPSYTPNTNDLKRFAETSRLLLEVERRHPKSLQVLSLYYGDAGARWGLERIGRIASLFPITKTGQRLLRDSRARYKTSEDIRDDEIIATEIDLQFRQPNDIRGKKQAMMREEADELLTEAHLNWKAAKRACNRRQHPAPAND